MKSRFPLLCATLLFIGAGCTIAPPRTTDVPTPDLVTERDPQAPHLIDNDELIFAITENNKTRYVSFDADSQQQTPFFTQSEEQPYVLHQYLGDRSWLATNKRIQEGSVLPGNRLVMIRIENQHATLLETFATFDDSFYIADAIANQKDNTLYYIVGNWSELKESDALYSGPFIAHRGKQVYELPGMAYGGYWFLGGNNSSQLLIAREEGDAGCQSKEIAIWESENAAVKTLDSSQACLEDTSSRWLLDSDDDPLRFLSVRREITEKTVTDIVSVRTLFGDNEETKTLFGTSQPTPIDTPPAFPFEFGFTGFAGEGALLGIEEPNDGNPLKGKTHILFVKEGAQQKTIDTCENEYCSLISSSSDLGPFGVYQKGEMVRIFDSNTGTLADLFTINTETTNVSAFPVH